MILIYNSHIYNIMMVDYNKDIRQKVQLDIIFDKNNFMKIKISLEILHSIL